ncbi:MAG TPA: hypothetical protein VJ697_16685 [Nitrososphaeraceae archaeon]|nr:hypothetical protein [Nitrososphaeraceae archaeon]
MILTKPKNVILYCVILVGTVAIRKFVSLSLIPENIRWIMLLESFSGSIYLPFRLGTNKLSLLVIIIRDNFICLKMNVKGRTNI